MWWAAAGTDVKIWIHFLSPETDTGIADIFGIKVSAQAAEGMAPGSWPGRNLLGRALMEIREELRPSADIADMINSSLLDSINRILRNGETC